MGGTDRHPTCRPRVAAPQASCPVGPVLWSRLPRKPWSSYKPTGHAGRAMGEQRGFLKTRLNVFLSTSEPMTSRGVTMKPYTRQGLKLGQLLQHWEIWGWSGGRELASNTSPPAPQPWEVESAEPAPAARPQLPRHPEEWGAAQRPGQSSPHKTGSWCHQRGSAWVARDRQRGGASRQCAGRPQGPRPTPGPPRPTHLDQLSVLSSHEILSEYLMALSPPLRPKESKWPGGWEVDPSPRADTLQG